MRSIVYYLMCLAHRLAKKAVKQDRDPLSIRFVDITEKEITENQTVFLEIGSSDETGESTKEEVKISELYPVENAVPLGSNCHLRSSFAQGASSKNERQHLAGSFSPDLWREFIDGASIPEGFRNAGLKYAGYIASGRNSWCLPSWIWTNAAIVRYLCAVGHIDQARCVGDKLLSQQENDGGWVVRSDYTSSAEVPVIAPNDSAYIANNACLELYEKTQQIKYLEAAERCADWIIETARPDGLVWTGLNRNSGEWLKSHTIVDTGFTAGLFAKLFLLKNEARYKDFLERFAHQFVDLFFDPQKDGFATSIDRKNRKVGGRFARGQAWALEGLIPTFKALRSEWLRNIIEANLESLLRHQLPNGAWPYNLDRPYYGEDCKGVPVIAKAMLDWNVVNGDQGLAEPAQRAIDWCKAHTALSGQARGGIFSFNLEGAVVHNLYTKTAFVYSSAYALECLGILHSYE